MDAALLIQHGYRLGTCTLTHGRMDSLELDIGAYLPKHGADVIPAVIDLSYNVISHVHVIQQCNLFHGLCWRALKGLAMQHKPFTPGCVRRGNRDACEVALC